MREFFGVVEFERQADGTLAVLDIREWKSQALRARDINEMRRGAVRGHAYLYATFNTKREFQTARRRMRGVE